MVAALAFIFMRTVLTAWYSNAEASSSDRVVSRNAIAITQPLPLAYKNKVAAISGVTAVTVSNWFGGIYKDRRNFFAQFAVEGETALDVFEIKFVQGTREAFLRDRNACIVGTRLADKYGWKIGDTVPLQGDIYPGDWRFTIAGFVEAEDASVANTMYFHWARLNEGLPDRAKNTIGVFTATIANANDSPRVIRDIDALFANSDNETHTETEKAFRLQFVAGSGAILTALEAVSFVILVIMALILGNTLAMGLRERTGELGAMRAIGFLPWHVRALAISEGTMLGAVGGLLGVLAARPILIGFGKTMASMGFLANLGFKLPTAIATVLAAAAIGAAASTGPAIQAARLNIVDALRRQE